MTLHPLLRTRLLSILFWAAPLTWLAQLALNYVLTNRACVSQASVAGPVVAKTPMYLLVLNLVAVSITLAALLVGLWRAWNLHRMDNARSGPVSFLAVFTTLAGGLFAAAALFQTFALLVVPPCG